MQRHLVMVFSKLTIECDWLSACQLFVYLHLVDYQHNIFIIISIILFYTLFYNYKYKYFASNYK